METLLAFLVAPRRSGIGLHGTEYDIWELRKEDQCCLRQAPTIAIVGLRHSHGGSPSAKWKRSTVETLIPEWPLAL
jgi:hypothetical protein